MHVITDSCSPLNPLISLLPPSLLMFLSFLHCLSFFFLISFFSSSLLHRLCFYFSQTFTLIFVSFPSAFLFLHSPYFPLFLLLLHSLSSLPVLFCFSPLTSPSSSSLSYCLPLLSLLSPLHFLSSLSSFLPPFFSPLPLHLFSSFSLPPPLSLVLLFYLCRERAEAEGSAGSAR